MESLLANYASSDEEEEEKKQHSHDHQQSSNSSNPRAFFSPLPPPKSSSSSLFSVLPPPKTTKPDPIALPEQKPKKIVQFKPPPVSSFSVKSNAVDDDDEDDEGEKEKKRKKSESSGQTSSVKSFLSSILPAPKNSTTLGVLGSGSGRRSAIETDVPVPNLSGSDTHIEPPVNYNENQQVDGSLESSSSVAGDYAYWGAQGYVDNEGYAGYGNSEGSDYSHGIGPSGDQAGYGSSFGTYTGYEQYGHNWTDGSTATAASEIMEIRDVALRLPGKRGRNDAPQQIVEVNQDELMKNRPREDQTRLTGIAFGPSYQPVSNKGKPSKLHKRKHQIGTLYFDMKQKEMELAERRARGMQTKAQTQGKYGW